MQPEKTAIANTAPDSLVSIPKAGLIMDIGKTKVWALIADGTLDVVRLGRRCTRVKKSSIDRLISRGA